MDSGDEAFAYYIEVDNNDIDPDYVEIDNEDIDYRDGSDTENSQPTGRQAKIRQSQIGKIVAFLTGNDKWQEANVKLLITLASSEHNEQVIVDTSVYARLWEDLTVQLNELGPPTKTSKEWKKAWSGYKYSNKKRLPALFVAARQSIQQSSADGLHLQVLQDISKVMVQQGNILQRLDEHSAIIARSQSLLEEISKRI